MVIYLAVRLLFWWIIFIFFFFSSFPSPHLHGTFQVKRVSRNNGPTRRFYRCCRSTSVREATRGASPGLHAILPNTHIHLAKKHTPLKTIRYFFLAVVIETAICGCRHASRRCLTAVFLSWLLFTMPSAFVANVRPCPVPCQGIVSQSHPERERERESARCQLGKTGRAIDGSLRFIPPFFFSFSFSCFCCFWCRRLFFFLLMTFQHD